MNREQAAGRYDRRRNTPPAERKAEEPYGSRRQAAHAKAPRKGSWFGRHKVLTCVIAVVLLAGAVCAALLLRVASDPGSLLVNRPGASGAAAAPGASGQPGYDFPKDIVNILVLGTDANAERVRQGMNARTDCMMLASINTTTKQVSLISIPRDTYVMIYDENNEEVSRNRVNAAFAFGGGLKKNGIAYAKNTVIQCLGGQVPIDHFVLFDMDLVKNLIDDVGGVTVDVDISVSVKSVGVSLKPGEQKLNGIQALTYARDRHNTKGGDFGRVGHQQQVMIALLRELQNKGNIVTKIPELYESFAGNVTTNPELGAMQIAALAWIAKDVNVAGVKQYTLTGKSHTIKGASIVISDQEKKKEILKEVFGIDYEIRREETYEYLKGEVDEMLSAGTDVVNRAKSLLNDNKQYYTADDAKALKSAISAWTTASKKNDSEAMQEALEDVQTEYAILKNIIDKNKNKPKDTPKPEDTEEPEVTPEPETTSTPKKTASPTDTPKPEETATPEPEETATPKPEKTATSEPTDESSTSTTDTGEQELSPG
jgi:LCP family protein required for cell wall assembly